MSDQPPTSATLSEGAAGTAAAADAIREVERMRLRALVEGDMETARSLHADDFQLVTPSGRIHTRESYLGAIASDDLRYLVFEPRSDIEVRVHGTFAAIRYQSRIEMERLQADCWHTDTYEFRDGRWQIVWSQATQIR